MGLQLDYDASLAKETLAAVLSKIKPWVNNAHAGVMAQKGVVPDPTCSLR